MSLFDAATEVQQPDGAILSLELPGGPWQFTVTAEGPDTPTDLAGTSCSMTVPASVVAWGDSTVSGSTTVSTMTADLLTHQRVTVVCVGTNGTVELGSIALVAQPG